MIFNSIEDLLESAFNDSSTTIVGERQRQEDWEIIEAMEKYGGNFVQAIAKACYCADGNNYMKIREAFPELFEEYKKFLTK